MPEERGYTVKVSLLVRKAGELWECYRRHFGLNGDPAILVAQAASRELNGGELGWTPMRSTPSLMTSSMVFAWASETTKPAVNSDVRPARDRRLIERPVATARTLREWRGGWAPDGRSSRMPPW